MMSKFLSERHQVVQRAEVTVQTATLIRSRTSRSTMLKTHAPKLHRPDVPGLEEAHGLSKTAWPQHPLRNDIRDIVGREAYETTLRPDTKQR